MYMAPSFRDLITEEILDQDSSSCFKIGQDVSDIAQQKIVYCMK